MRTWPEAQVGVVLAQEQTVLDPRGEHPVRFVSAFGDKVVNHYADVRVGAGQLQRGSLLHAERGVGPGHKPLGRGFLVTGGAVYLPREVEVAERAGFERGEELGRVRVVVLDGVARSEHTALFKSIDGPEHPKLGVNRQAGRDTVRIALDRIRALGLDEDVVPVALRELHNLVLD